MKVFFKALGVLIILAVGLAFRWYGNLNRSFDKAEKAFIRGDYEVAEALYRKGIENFEKLHISKVRHFKKEIERINLARARSFYYQAYYDSNIYELAEKIVAKELEKEKNNYKDQFYDLKTLIFWQKGVNLFIELGKKAANSEELNRLLEEALNSSDKAVKNLTYDERASVKEGLEREWNIKYRFEFLRQPKKKLMQSMQNAADQKQKPKEIKKEMQRVGKEKETKESQQKQEKKEGEVSKDKKRSEQEEMKILVPSDKKDKSEDNPSGSSQKKKKKKG